MRLVLRASCLIFALLLLVLSGVLQRERQTTNPASFIIFQRWAGGSMADIYRANADGSHLVKLTDDMEVEDSILPAPQGNWIVYTSSEGAYKSFYRLRWDGKVRQTIAQPARENQWYSAAEWSPSGERLVYVHNQNGMDTLGIMRPDGSDKRAIGDEAVRRCEGSEEHQLYSEQFPHWSADAAWIYYNAYFCDYTQALYRTRPDGSERQMVLANTNGQCCWVWSPDHEWLIFQTLINAEWYLRRLHIATGEIMVPDFGADRVGANLLGGHPEWVFFTGGQLSAHYPGYQEIYRMRWDGSQVENITHARRMDYAPMLDAAGEWLYFESRRDKNVEIYRMRVDGSDVQNLTQHPARDGYPVFSPDGKWLYFESNRGNGRRLYRMHVDGSQVEELPLSPSNYSGLMWLPITTKPWHHIELLLLGAVGVGLMVLVLGRRR